MTQLGQVRADEGPAPKLSAATMPGVWEAAPSWMQCVFRLDFRAPMQTTLAFRLGGHDHVYALVEGSVSSGKVRLRFRRINHDDGASADVLTIDGEGYGTRDAGTFRGTLKMKVRLIDGEIQDSLPVSFSKGEWTRELDRMSRQAEELIRKNQRRRSGNAEGANP